MRWQSSVMSYRPRTSRGLDLLGHEAHLVRRTVDSVIVLRLRQRSLPVARLLPPDCIVPTEEGKLADLTRVDLPCDHRKGVLDRLPYIGSTSSAAWTPQRMEQSWPACCSGTSGRVWGGGLHSQLLRDLAGVTRSRIFEFLTWLRVDEVEQVPLAEASRAGRSPT